MSVIYIRRGDTRVLDLTATTPADLPYNLTGVDLSFTVKRGFDDDDADAVITKTVGSGISLTDAAGGMASITLDAADTSGLRPGAPLVYDIQAIDNDEVVTLDSGELRVMPDVRRAVS